MVRKWIPDGFKIGSDDWNMMVDELNTIPVKIKSDPPAGMKKVINIYVDPDTQKLKIEWDDT